MRRLLLPLFAHVRATLRAAWTKTSDPSVAAGRRHIPLRAHREEKRGGIFLGLLLLLLAAALEKAGPDETIVLAAIFFGAYLLVTGISQVFHAFTLHISGGGRALLFISGAASLVLAVLCFKSIANSVLLLAIWIGIGFIFRGVAESASAISDPATPGRGWQIFMGVVTLIAGIIVMSYPISSLATLTLVVGIWLIILGVMEIVVSFGIRKAGSNVRTAVGEALGAR